MFDPGLEGFLVYLYEFQFQKEELVSDFSSALLGFLQEGSMLGIFAVGSMDESGVQLRLPRFL